MSEITKLRDDLREFATERDWDQFHSPKNLASALAVEAAELLEPFQWLTEEQSRNLDEKRRGAVAEELADVQIYLIRLADKLDVDLLNAVRAKMVRNAEKYPVSSNEQRLDGENGLLLTPTVDHLFDKGFIFFEDSGQLIVSPVADPVSIKRMGIDHERRINVGAFSEGQQRYLDFHRENVLRMARLKD